MHPELDERTLDIFHSLKAQCSLPFTPEAGAKHPFKRQLHTLPDGYAMLMRPITRPKQLSMAATARVIWLCACVRYWPDPGLVFELDLPQVVLSFLSDEVGETSDEVARRRLVSPA